MSTKAEIPLREVHPQGAPPPASWLSILTTEHYTLQMQRTSTIAETNGRASMFLGSVSAGLVAIGFASGADPKGVGFIAFGLVVLSTLTCLGVVSFARSIQTSIDDADYAIRIDELRDAYAELAPELGAYLSVARRPEQAVSRKVRHRAWQQLVTVAGSIAMVTAVLFGGASGLLVRGMHGSVPAAVSLGAIAGLVALAAMLRWQAHQWRGASSSIGLDRFEKRAFDSGNERHEEIRSKPP
jgi:hypothetical protein